jgi:DNA invertase Pin-like site-specific DNA recombinase
VRPKGKFINKNYHGERVHTAKLTADDVRLIDRLLSDGELKQSEIARKFNVSRNAIYDIARGYSWKQVTGVGA